VTSCRPPGRRVGLPARAVRKPERPRVRRCGGAPWRTTSGARSMRDEWDEAEGTNAPPVLRVLLYSDNPQTREAVLTAVGTRAAKDLPTLEWIEVATHAAVVSRVEEGGCDLLVLIGRQQDRWLASWSEADAVVARPLDPLPLQETVAPRRRPPPTTRPATCPAGARSAPGSAGTGRPRP